MFKRSSPHTSCIIANNMGIICGYWWINMALFVVIELTKILNLMNQRGMVHLSKIKILQIILQYTVEESQFAVAHDSDIIMDDTVQV